MQKNVVIGIMMACILLGSIGLAVGTKLTVQDVTWAQAIVPYMKTLGNDASVVGAAGSTGNLDVVKRACDLAVEDVISAEAANNAYTVSPAIQPSKDDFTNVLTYAWSGFSDVSKGCSAQDSTLITQGTNELQMCNYYMTMFSRDLDVAMAA